MRPKRPVFSESEGLRPWDDFGGTLCVSVAWPTDNPAGAAFAAWILMYSGLRVWSQLDDGPILLARAEPSRRDDRYTMFNSSSASMLAVTLTVLALLYALPERPAIREARDSHTWPAIQGLLLSIDFFCLIALVTAHIGLAVDHGERGVEWLEQIMLISALVATLALLLRD